jgi:hypothetical protein
MSTWACDIKCASALVLVYLFLRVAVYDYTDFSQAT